MFKQTFGFDHEVLKQGTAIRIEDSATWKPHTHMMLEQKSDYFKINLTGNYIVCKSSPLEIQIIGTSGDILEIPIRHFVSPETSPRMTIRVLE